VSTDYDLFSFEFEGDYVRSSPQAGSRISELDGSTVIVQLTEWQIMISEEILLPEQR
jgi:hypothetical protein